MRFYDYRVPIIAPERYAGGYHGIPVDTGHRLYHEPLVPLESVGVACACYHARTDGANPPYHRPVKGSRPDVWSRKTVAEKLAGADERLRPSGVELLVLDGCRPIECQQGLWDFYYTRARQTLGPSASRDDCRREALNYVADPTGFHPEDSTTWPSHTNGAAVDITLRDRRSGEILDMGSNFEEIADASVCDYFERLLERGHIAPDDPRLIHRRLLHRAMSEAGFMNDPFVFWHYDWGNQLYIKIRRALFGDAPAAAWYGYIAPPD